MRFPDETVKILWKDTYLAMIRNSIGTKLFRNAYATAQGKKQDILRNGDLSCAVFVSTILSFIQLLNRPHTTVTGTITAMKRAGWREIRKPKVGAILIWEFKKGTSGEAHRHIGFYIGKNKAISNNPEKGYPLIHHWTFGQTKGKITRRVEAMYWHKALS